MKQVILCQSLNRLYLPVLHINYRVFFVAWFQKISIPTEGFLVWTPLPPGIVSLAFETPSPSEFPMTFLGVGTQLHNLGHIIWQWLPRMTCCCQGGALQAGPPLALFVESSQKNPPYMYILSTSVDLCHCSQGNTYQFDDKILPSRRDWARGFRPWSC